MKGIVDNKTKLIKMLYDGQEVPLNSHIAEIEPCKSCKGNVGWTIKPLGKERKRSKVKPLKVPTSRGL